MKYLSLFIVLIISVNIALAITPASNGNTVMQASGKTSNEPGTTILKPNSVATHTETCGCQATPCPNTCNCCKVKHITPEIKQEPKCNCCHLDKCGCCVKKTIPPELKNTHVAPELKKESKCPCLAEKKCFCRK